ncbi:omptin family outer membrane protease [Xenorhabdus sp. XENO-10]|uniref:Omptin family outer membrane protease n=1 Tax=Xenorhabdus yunnanensis TaxID=3025878 RepID=A0ABT5LAL2_9GAMM|nr:omptin family outer membrane protease [Xenorhabdus yunnanensis]MDC9588068.1 omptin family outer membrane protease [Xenorhabdus yunnanensis]
MKRNLITLSIISLAATQTVNASPINFTPSSVSVNASLGWLSGQSNEYTYSPENGRKFSELNWKFKNTTIIKGDLSWDALPYLTLNARGWTTLSSGSGKMDDYYWGNPNRSKWTHWSHHENTKLDDASEFDVNLKGWVLKQSNYKLGGLFGYQQTEFNWTASGGSGVYNNKVYDLKNKPVITYQQKFSMPYMGLTGQYRYQDFEFNALLKFSPWVQAKDKDEHILRNSTYKTKISQSRYYAVSVDAGYYITPNMKIFSELSWNKFANSKKGSIEATNHSNRSSHTYNNAGSMDNTNYTISAGVQYRF